MGDEAGENIIDARDAAESAGLMYINEQSSGITRRKSGKARAIVARAGPSGMHPAGRAAAEDRLAPESIPVDSPDAKHAAAPTLANAASFTPKTEVSRVRSVALCCIAVEARR